MELKHIAMLTPVPLALVAVASAQTSGFRPPSVPLVAHDPLFSIWSSSDTLAGADTVHWTQKPNVLASLIRVDGVVYRLMGTQPSTAAELPQLGLKVTPTRSIYDFGNAKVKVTLTFTSSLLPSDLEVMTRPVTYLTWDVQSADGKSHDVSLYDSMASAVMVNTPDTDVTWERESFGGIAAAKTGAADPTMLSPSGDATRINWGSAYIAAPSNQAIAAAGSSVALINSFALTGKVPSTDDTRKPRLANDDAPVVALSFDLGSVGTALVSRHAMLAIDEGYAIQYLGQKQRPYWRRKGETINGLLPKAEREYASITKRCAAFDAQLMADMSRIGGDRYAQIGALAYRQCLAGCGYAADAKGMPMIYVKENSSNGCIATTDVFFPAAPQFLMMGSAFAKGLVAPVLVYTTSPEWTYHFAPHDLGTYPHADGQVYGVGTEADMMPVEESGNMLILMLAIAKMDGNADFASKYWRQLTLWEAYLEKYGKDPENQLCTDDFMGHLAHNANLSVKAILAIASYGELCRMRGDIQSADKYQALAKEYAANWVQVAGDGDHYRLAFDKPNTWSQKYNLVWDKILGLNVFPAKVAQQEVAFYLTQLQPYGLPLDSRTKLSKTDWSVWSATMAESQADFEKIVSPIYDFLNTTGVRLPLVDSYYTNKKDSGDFRARPVVGGVFIKMVSDPATWTKYVSQGAKVGNGYAPYPKRPTTFEVIPSSKVTPQTWRYTIQTPTGDWKSADYNDQAWKEGLGGFGTDGTPSAVVKTVWSTDDIWIRRTVTIPADAKGDFKLSMHHDDGVEVYFNGKLATKDPGATGRYEIFELTDSAKALIKPGAKITIAIHCHQDGGGQYIDAGIIRVK